MSSNSVTLAIYPNTRGFGFACMEGSKTILDFGVVSVRPICNKKTLRRFQCMVDYYQPTLLLIQDPKGKYGCHGKRTRQLIKTIEEYAEVRGLGCEQYSREQIRFVFDQFDATTKHEIASKITKWFPDLETYKPEPRKLWLPDSYYMGAFDAISLICTHYYLTL